MYGEAQQRESLKNGKWHLEPSPVPSISLSEKMLKEYSRIFSILVSHNRSLTRKYNKTSDIANFYLFAPIHQTKGYNTLLDCDKQFNCAGFFLQIK